MAMLMTSSCVHRTVEEEVGDVKVFRLRMWTASNDWFSIIGGWKRKDSSIVGAAEVECNQLKEKTSAIESIK